MNNHTTKSIISQDFVVSIGHLASILSLLLILVLILITLFFLFNKQKTNIVFNEQDFSSEFNESQSFSTRRSRQYSSTIPTKCQQSNLQPSIASFTMDIDDSNTRSTMNLLSNK